MVSENFYLDVLFLDDELEELLVYRFEREFRNCVFEEEENYKGNF